MAMRILLNISLIGKEGVPIFIVFECCSIVEQEKGGGYWSIIEELEYLVASIHEIVSMEIHYIF